MPFAVGSRQADGVTVVDVGGEVDVETAPRMRAALAAAVDAGLPVVVDLGEVTFMDSFGSGVAAAHQQGARVGTPVLLRAVSASDPPAARPARPRRGPRHQAEPDRRRTGTRRVSPKSVSGRRRSGIG